MKREHAKRTSVFAEEMFKTEDSTPPAVWLPVQDPASGQTYYHNPVSGETSWKADGSQ